MRQRPARPADAVAAGVVLLLGLYEMATSTVAESSVALVLVVAAVAAAVGLSRGAPGTALALVWATCLLQILGDVPILLVQFAVAVVAFNTARWGSRRTAALGGASIPAACVLGVLIDARIYRELAAVLHYRPPTDATFRYGETWQVAAALLVMALLGVSWLIGLALRFSARATQSRESQTLAEQEAVRAQRESDQAREIAQLKDAQVRMARDVHDVVGHSLAVILAQAESAQYLPDADPDALRTTMATIATSARSSLQDVRQVLSTTREAGPPRPGGLDSLIEGVRASGHAVLASEVGTPQPLPPELAVVAFRVLQEMLTNAIKHGRRDQPVLVELRWPEGIRDGDLRIEVRNIEAQTPDADDARPSGGRPGGQGLDGMRLRLASVGGRIELRRRDEPAGVTFTATAWLPVRAGA